ncbi:MAG TPA: SMP-30/gluconolactonase/LRE family protein [Gaiellaceae bacterium]
METTMVELVRVVATDAHEGPVYVPDEHALYFTSVLRPRPHVAIRRLDLASGEITTVVDGANGANGMTLDRDGRILVCEQGTRMTDARISRLDPRTGGRQTVVESYRGLPLNSPNDIVVASDGAIWFTDPSYGYLQGFRPPSQLPDAVYRFDGTLASVADSFEKPNGLAFSPDERTLYVGDSEACVIYAFDVVSGRLENQRLFTEISPGYPDGIKVTPDGRVFSSCASGLQIFDPAGELVGEIELPGAVNFTFGDALYITTDTAVWAAKGA